MIKTTFLSLAFLSFISFAFVAPKKMDNTCSIYGKITEDTSKTVIPFANVVLLDKNLINIANTTSDANGDYCFKNLIDGTYKLVVSYVGYQKAEIQNIAFIASTPMQINVTVKRAESLALLEIVNYSPELMSSAPVTKSPNFKGKKKERAAYSNVTFSSNRSNDFNTEEYSKIDDNEFKEAKKNPLSTFSIDVDKASYSNVRRFITQGSLPPADAVRVEEMINYFSYKYPQPTSDEPFSISTEYTICPWNTKHNLIHIGMQGKEIETTKMETNNLVFLIDVSGSMASDDKLGLVKSGLRLLAQQMRDEDQISIVVYAGAAGVVLPPTSGKKKEKIFDALEKLEAGGSTAGGEGILLAYKTAKESFLTNGNNRVVLATDGDFNVGISSEGELIRLIEQKREEGVFLSVLGVGTGNYKDSKMEQLADKGNGNYNYLDNILEAKKVLVKEMGGTLVTIAKDVKIQIEFNPAKVKGYRLVGYENRVLAAEDFNDDKKDAGELGSGHSVTAIYEIIPAGSSEEIASVDSLKYQKNISSDVSSSLTNEVMTIKFRYKEPKENTSKLITKVLLDKKIPLESTSENLKFAAAVSEFGMLLRDSKYKGKSDYKTVLTMAREAKGTDNEGYRAEFIRLVEMAELLKK